MKEIERRTFVKLGLAAAAGTALVPNWIERALASPSETAKWRQFEGETVKILCENTPPSLGIKATAENFTTLTGMKTEFTLHAMDELKEKMFLDLRSGKPEYIVNYAQMRPIGCVVCDFWQPIDNGLTSKPENPKYRNCPMFPMPTAISSDHLFQSILMPAPHTSTPQSSIPCPTTLPRA